MVSWSEFKNAEPELAGIGEQRLIEPGVLLLGTTRKDGTARITPLEPLISEGQLYLGMMWGSKKALDLQRDPRVLVHSIVTDKNATGGDYKLRGTTREVEGDEKERYAAAFEAKMGFPVPRPYHLFAVDIQEVAYLTFADEMNMRQWRA